MKKKTLQIAVLAALFIGAIALYRKGKTKKDEVIVIKEDKFTIVTPRTEDQSAKMEFWREGEKYFIQETVSGKATPSREIPKADFDKYHQQYLN